MTKNDIDAMTLQGAGDTLGYGQIGHFRLST